MKRKRDPQDPRNREDGSYLVLGAVLLLALFMAAGVGVDLSRKFRLEQMVQDIADAAALAGARALPDSVAARQVAVEYIRQHVGGPTIDTAAFYTPADSDIAVFVNPLTLTSGTVGVVVRANWDPIFIPNFLEGSQLMAIERYAIAIMTRGVTYDTISGDIDNSPGADYALFVGDTGAFTSSSTGNNMQISGSAHFNHCAEVSGIGSEIDSGSTFEATCLIGGITGTTEVPSPIVETPQIDESQLNYDVTFDISDPAQAAYYVLGVAQPILLSDGSTLKAENGSLVKATYNGLDVNGVAQWSITADQQNQHISGIGNTGVGNGIDIKVVGALTLNVANSNAGGFQRYFQGSVTTTDKLTMAGNNSEFRATPSTTAVDGLDNKSLAIFAGSEMGAADLAFDNGGNAMNIYGILYSPGTALWTGNMSNPASSDIGTPGSYDGSGNGFVKGMVIVATLSTDNGGGLLGNNIKIWYDGELAGDLPVENAVTPPRLGSPQVSLID